MMMNSAVRLLDRAAEKWPDKIYTDDEYGTLTFGQTRTMARRAAAGLLRLGLDTVRPALVVLPRCGECVACFMAVLYTGNPYAPAAVDAPLSRLQKIIQNLRPGVVITTAEKRGDFEKLELYGAGVVDWEELKNAAPDDRAVDARLDNAIDTDPAYIIYTSGSTGTPKGVTVAGRSVLDYARWVTETFSFGENSVMGAQAPFYFDNSVHDIYGALYAGARLVLIPEKLLMFPSKIPEFLVEKGCTSVFWVPTVMINIANSGVLGTVPMPRLKLVSFAGEVMPNAPLNVWRQAHPDCAYANLYGPTEITDVCIYYVVDRAFADSEPLPIGRACRNMRALILTEDGRLAQQGEQGEICLVGTGVALGYWNAPELTEKVFVQNPLHSRYHETIYRSGDLGWVNDRGEIIYAGRMDSQIKVKGNRIELGEVECAAMCVPGVENACALFDAGKQQIVLAVESGQTYTLRRFNLEMKKYVPAYMLPARLEVMRALPLNANRKIDRVLLRRTLLEEN